MKKFTSLLLLLLLTKVAVSSTLINGIYYNLNPNEKTASVTYQYQYNGSYTGDVVIPETVTYDDIQYNVTAITANAFYGCSRLTSVTIPANVKSIGISAFYGCYSLTSITIPENITTLENSTFSDCSGLVSVSIPSGVKSIGEYCFSGCRSLTSISLPDDLTTMGSYAFQNCSSITTITIGNKVESVGYSAFEGCLGLTTVSFHCKKIGQWFNMNTYIKEVTIGDEVESIGNNAFNGFKGLTSIKMNNVRTIGNAAFSNCENLETITFSDSLKTIDDNAFYYCKSLKSVVLPPKIESVSNIAFNQCENIESVTLLMPTISSWFSNKYNLKEIILGDSVKVIGENAFQNCRSLTSITMPNSISTVGKLAFFQCEKLASVKMSDGLTDLGESAFHNCTSLTHIDIPTGLTSIGNYVFYGCSGLASLIIPNNITSIGYRAFYNCGLSSLTIGSNVKTIDNSFSGGIKKVIWLGNTPPTGYTYATGAINYVSNDSYSFSSKYVYPFLSSVFEVDGIRYVPVSPSERTCDAIDCVYDSTSVNTTVGTQVIYRGISMTVKKAMPYLCYNNKNIKNLAWNYGGDIPNYAFAECANIQQFYTNEPKGLGCLVIDEKVNSIGNYAFSGCKEFSTVIISDRDSLLTLGSNGISPLFASFALDSVYIGGNISYPTGSGNGYSPFYRNTSLRSVVITDKETEISPNEFYGCTNLRNVSIGDSVTVIGDYAFSGCSSLNHFAFGASVNSIGKEAFSDCTSVGRIISKAEVPPVCGSQALDDINKWDCQLSVPEGCLSAYQGADQWKEFFFVDEKALEEGIEDNPDTPGTKKCATPTISYADGKLTFDCATEGARCIWTIKSNDVGKGEGNSISLFNQYQLTVYATTTGYEDSDRATATLVWGNGDAEGDNIIRIGSAGASSCDVNGDGVINVADITTIIKMIAGQE